MGLREKRFQIGEIAYRFKKSPRPTHRWRLFRADKFGANGLLAWEMLRDGMSKAEAERMYKLLKG